MATQDELKKAQDMSDERCGGDVVFGICSMCSYCARLWIGIGSAEGKACCDAYPQGVPVEITDGRVNHQYPYDGDGGLTFVQGNITKMPKTHPHYKGE